MESQSALFDSISYSFKDLLEACGSSKQHTRICSIECLQHNWKYKWDILSMDEIGPFNSVHRVLPALHTPQPRPNSTALARVDIMSETSSQSIPGPASAATGAPITLQIGERRFVTLPGTLTQESGFFATLLSGRWGSAQADGSYFVDADPRIFEHILRYLRRGVLPIFYDDTKGHDHALYLAVLEEAKYFEINRLERWLLEKTYLKAVKIVRQALVYGGAEYVDETTEADLTIEYFPIWRTKQVYVCPRGIAAHKGDPRACDRLCKGARGDDPDEYVDEEYLKIFEIRKRTVINREMCLKGR